MKPREPPPDGGKDKDKGVPKANTVCYFFSIKVLCIGTMINTVNIFLFKTIDLPVSSRFRTAPPTFSSLITFKSVNPRITQVMEA